EHATAVEHGAEDLELRVAEDVTNFDEFHSKTQVRLVGAVAADRIGVGHAREWRWDFDTFCFAEDSHEQAFDQSLDLDIGNERCLHIELRKLGLPVRAKV